MNPNTPAAPAASALNPSPVASEASSKRLSEDKITAIIRETITFLERDDEPFTSFLNAQLQRALREMASANDHERMRGRRIFVHAFETAKMNQPLTKEQFKNFPIKKYKNPAKPGPLFCGV